MLLEHLIESIKDMIAVEIVSVLAVGIFMGFGVLIVMDTANIQIIVIFGQ